VGGENTGVCTNDHLEKTICENEECINVDWKECKKNVEKHSLEKMCGKMFLAFFFWFQINEIQGVCFACGSRMRKAPSVGCGEQNQKELESCLQESQNAQMCCGGCCLCKVLRVGEREN
jgi:hypothetical protein